MSAIQTRRNEYKHCCEFPARRFYENQSPFIILLRDFPAQVLKTLAELQTGTLRSDACHGRLVDLRGLHSLTTSQLDLPRRFSISSGNPKGKWLAKLLVSPESG
jgi:hypothetical protein